MKKKNKMRIKDLRIKNFFTCKEEIVIGFSPTGLTKLTESTDYSVDISLDEFLKGIGRFLLKKTSKVDFRPNDYTEPIEMSITLISGGSNEVGYNAIFTLDEFISESLVIDHKLAVYVDQSEVTIGPGFTGTGEDEEILLNLYETYKSTKFVASFIPSLSYDYPGISCGVGKFFGEELLIADSTKGFKWGVYPFIKEILQYSESIQDKVRSIIPVLGFGVNEITKDWKIITDYDPTGKLSVVEHGSGFRILLHILPMMFNVIENPEKCLFVTSLSGLHPNLRKTLMDGIIGPMIENKNSQIFYR